MKLEVPNQNYPEIRKTYQRLRYIAVNDCEWLSMTFTSSYHSGDRGLYQNQIPIERQRESRAAWRTICRVNYDRLGSNFSEKKE